MTMHLKQKDVVKLLPTWTFPSSHFAPTWGGTYGYHLGVVEQIHTGDHNKDNHIAVVKWDSGFTGNFPESALAVMTNDERDIALDEQASGFPIDRDIWALIQTNRGNFGLNVIECCPFGRKDQKNLQWVVGGTRMALSSPDNSDYNLVATVLSYPDYHEYKVSKLFTAATQIHTLWDLPELDALPLPLPEFPSISAASKTAPKSGPSICFFHLPLNLIDYSDYPSAVT